VGQATFLTLPTPTGGVAPYTWAVAGGSTLPPGLSLLGGAQVLPTVNPGQAILAGAPTAPGTFTFDLVATDATGAQVVRTFTLNVSTISLLSGFRIPSPGVAYSQQLTTVGGVLPYTYSVGPNNVNIPMLPPGITLTPGGLLSGTTTSSGVYQARVTVVDGAGNRFTRLIAMTVRDGSGSFVSVPTSIQDMSIGTGRFQPLSINNSTALLATWSHVAGTLPPGISLAQNTPSAGLTALTGRATAPGTYVFTLRAAQPSNPSNFVEREFTYRVVPMQIVSPPVELIEFDLPSAQIGQPYSTTIKLAGGTPPYTFTQNPLLPLPAGLSLSSTGVLSGTPQQRGFQTIAFDVTDAAGHTATSQQVALTITPSGVPAPLFALGTGFGQASVGVEFGNNIRGVLDLVVRGGVRPHSWSVNPGSTLPPGIQIIPGGNGVSDVLGGAPTTAGTYNFSLDVTDGVGQTATFPLTLTVVVPSIGPQAIPNGIVGSPYSATLTPAGGAPPYSNMQLNFGSDLPPGLTFSPGGLLSGTPTTAGNFAVVVFVTDANGQTVARVYRITINNAAGEAKPIAISPNPIQVSYVQGTPVPPTVMTVNGSAGIPFTAVISGIPGASLTTTSGTTPATVGLNLNLGSLSPGAYSGFVGVDAPTAANLYDFVPVVLTVLPPAPCTYAVNPTSGSVASGFAGGSFSVQTGVNCAWTAVPSANWITIISAASSSGPGNVSYFVTANPSPSARSGNITVNGAVYSITQFGTSCSFAINPPVINAPATGGSAVIGITASSPLCSWTASGLSATPTGGTGNGSVTVTIPPNGAPGQVVLNATIAGQTLAVNQVGVGCSVSLSSSATTITAAGGQGAVQVTAPVGCSYSTVTGPNWISVTSGGSGNGTGSAAPLIFNVSANSTTVARSGSLTIGGQTFQIDQEGLACSVTVDTSGLGSPYGPGGGVGLVGVTTNGSNCSWNASSAAGFASVSPLSGLGNGTVSVTVSSNAGSTTARYTSLTIGGQNVPIQQSGTTCTYNLQSTDGTVPASGGSGTVGVVAPAVCTWNAVSNTPPWLSALSTGGAGSSSVQFVAQANTSSSPRQGTLTVAGLTYTVSQAGAPCTYTLTTSSLNVASTGASSSFSFSTGAMGCSPAATSFTNWITGVTTSFNGASGTVDFTVDPSPYTTPRTGTIQLGDKTFTITQTGGTCGYSLSAYGALFGTLGGAGSVLGSPTALGCVPVTGTTQPTIITLSPLAGPVSNLFTQDYTVAPFNSLTPTVRRAQITFGGLLFTVKQSSY
jgi:hypothetical protein